MEQNNDEIIIKSTRGRPKLYESLKQHEKDTKYHQKYYHKTNKTVSCPHCGKQSTTRTMRQHQKSLKCSYITLKNEIQENV
jgi:predicted RNA-binding Zn-ribbon protein involved in translation (DUF1610 family)